MRMRLDEGGAVVIDFVSQERALLNSLTDELVVLVSTDDAETPDPALARMQPDAYPGDAEASDEFRRLTHEDMTEGILADARAVTAALASDDSIVLDAAAVWPWLRSLTRLRLALAARLDIQEDGDEGDPSPQAEPARQLYSWLGDLQGGVLAGLDAAANE